MEALRDIHHLVGDAVFEHRVADAFFHERGVDAQTHALLVGHGVGFLKSDRLRKTHPLDFGLQRLAAHDAAVFHIIGWRAEFLEKCLRREKHGEPVSAHLGVVGIQHADA